MVVAPTARAGILRISIGTASSNSPFYSPFYGCCSGGASGVTSPQLRVLVIGHNGQVSSSLCEVLPAAGYDVVRLGRPDIDLSNSNIVVDAILASRPDVVINPAAYT